MYSVVFAAPSLRSAPALQERPLFPIPARARRYCVAASASQSDAGSKVGKCYIVGAGPGPADLLTVRATQLLQQAEVIVYDDLGAQAAVEAYALPTAERIFVGKRGGRPSIKQPEIDAILVQQAATGRRVVRLKGGCPSVFSRVHSEIAALKAAGVPYEVCPGISSALAAPLAAGFPLTHPELSRAFAVTSAHDPGSMDWQALAAMDTLVLLMGGSSIGQIAEQLQRHGRAAGTPVAVVREAACAGQRVWRGTLGSIAQETEGESLSPCIIVVGGITELPTL